jgi:hypothetical protein
MIRRYWWTSRGKFNILDMDCHCKGGLKQDHGWTGWMHCGMMPQGIFTSVYSKATASGQEMLAAAGLYFY